MRILHSLAVAALFAGCGGDSTPSCEQVADHVLSLTKSSSGLEVAPRDALIAGCKSEESTNAKFRRCVMKATDVEGAKKCELDAALERMK